MKRTISATVVFAVGVVFVAVAFTANLFSVGPAFERLTKDFRPVMTPAAIATYRADIQGFSAVATEFRDEVTPALSSALGMSPAAFQAYVADGFPAVAAGMQALPAVTRNFGGVIDTLAAERARFTSADAIPTSWLPATTVPWIILFAGIAAMIVGLIMVRPGRAGARTALVLGALLVVLPLVMSFPSKASAADTMNDHLKPVYTAQLIAGANSSLTTMAALGTEMQQKMLPALGRALHMSPDQLNAFLGKNFPAVAAGLQGMPQAMTRFTTLVGVFGSNLSNYNTMKPVTLLPIAWTLIAGGIAIALFGGWALTRRHGEVLVMPAGRSKAA